MYTLPVELKQYIAQKKCVAFIGAGFSMPCGMPSWKGLVELLIENADSLFEFESDKLLIEQAKTALDLEDLPLAITLVQKLYTKSQITRFIYTTFHLDRYFDSPKKNRKIIDARLNSLLNSPWSGIITTNYDQLIEFGLQTHRQIETVSVSIGSHDFGNALVNADAFSRFYVKLHSSNDTSEFVLGTEDYDAVYLANNRVSTFLKAIMLNYRIVFIGCSLEDEVLRIRRKLCCDFNGGIPISYAILPENTMNVARQEQLLRQASIKTIFYPDGEHHYIDKYLAELKDYSMTSMARFMPLDSHVLESELKVLKKDDKLKKIGSINKTIFDQISKAAKSDEIDQVELIKKVRSFNSKANPDNNFEEFSDSEIVYRVLFLVNIGLLLSKRGADNTILYKVL